MRENKIKKVKVDWKNKQNLEDWKPNYFSSSNDEQDKIISEICEKRKFQMLKAYACDMYNQNKLIIKIIEILSEKYKFDVETIKKQAIEELKNASI